MTNERLSGGPPAPALRGDTRARQAEYRHDIDGLRAIAVLSVILFHINAAVLPGGFVGVDVFFVISGYLITRHTVEELDAGRFSLLEFYRRRIKRIAPAMILVVAATLGAAQLLMLPEDMKAVARSAFWSLASLANVYFWRSGVEEGYFAAASATKPLLHLWSLGVEEQFYLVWPIAMLFFYRFERQKGFLVAVALVAAGSFVLGDILFERDPSFVYYMLPTRAGELLVGALLAFALLRGVGTQLTAKTALGLGCLGLVTLGVSFFALSEALPFPGWRALVPTSGAAALILAGARPGTRLAGFLSSPALTWIGLCSYSAYLWHWPLVALFRYAYGEPGVAAGVGLLSATLVLAWMSYSMVELPARQTRASFSTVFVRYFILPSGVLAALAVLVVYADRLGMPLSSAEYRSRLQALQDTTRPAFQADFVCQSQKATPSEVTNPACVLGPGEGEPDVLLWGDSNASHYIGMLGGFAKEAGFRFRNIEVGSCPPVMIDPRPFVDPRRLSDCRASLALIRPLLDSYRTIVISASWSAYHARSSDFLDVFQAGIREVAGPDRRVILLGKVPVVEGYDRRCQEKALAFPFMTCPMLTVPLQGAVLDTNNELRRFADAETYVEYFDANEYLCPNGRCASHSPDGTPKYFDQSHLSLDASRELGNLIVARDGVPPVFAAIVR